MLLQSAIEHSILVPVITEVIVSLLLFAGGFFIGKYKEKMSERGKNLEEYDFYPYEVDKNNFPEFSLKDFRLAVHYFLKNKDNTAARQLIFIGEQNNIRNQLESTELKQYDKLFRKYQGSKIENDNNEYLENYARIVRLLGQTFKHMGIEILLHNLMNPTRSLVEIENGETTGRKTGMGTTVLVLDLKKRKLLNEDKLNYELNIEARRFKCTTIPIFRDDFGLIGAVCINIDINYISDEVLNSKERLEEFFKSYCKTDMELEENILSKDEFELAKKGKRHWRDTAYKP
ncbi:MAG TPA: PAS domain-containing protein [Bacteroidia bacterium]|nr:PAS domain-containing protein [Bacteroidia bacterium]